jgi:uncharacterized protein YggE
MADLSSLCKLGLASLALAATLAPAGVAAQQAEPRLRTLSVSGEGTITAAPEIASLRVGVTSESKTAREASQENADKMGRVVAALRKAGIPEDKIQTVQLTVEPAYDYNEGQQVLRGFQARNVVEARTRDLERLGEILDAVIQVGGNTVEGIGFELEDPGAAQTRALTRAVDDARRKAEALAKAAGVELGDIQEIAAAYGGGPIPLPMPRLASMEARMEAAPPPPVAPGELTVTASVQVVYRLR